METDGPGTLSLKAAPVVNVIRCSGCGRCVSACPVKIVTLEVNGYRKFAFVTDEERCTFCGRCVEACPVDAFDW